MPGIIRSFSGRDLDRERVGRLPSPFAHRRLRRRRLLGSPLSSFCFAAIPIGSPGQAPWSTRKNSCVIPGDNCGSRHPTRLTIYNHYSLHESYNPRRQRGLYFGLEDIKNHVPYTVGLTIGDQSSNRSSVINVPYHVGFPLAPHSHLLTGGYCVVAFVPVVHHCMTQRLNVTQ